MAETIEIGATPCDERCAQVGDADYPERSRVECRAFINLIRRAMGNPPEGAALIIKSNAHDAGTYREVAVKVEQGLTPDAERAAIEYAYRCESDSPTAWDAEARAELAAAGFPLDEAA